LAWQGTEEDEEGEQVSEQQTGSLVDLVQGARQSYRPSYEQLRASVDGEACAAWDLVDRQVSELRTFYEQLKEDERYSSEYKAEQAWKRFVAVKEKISRGTAKTKELLEKQIHSRQQFSIPMPQGEPVHTHDANKLIASQNEASRIVRKIDRLDSTGKGPFKPDRTEMLRSEYARGLEIGGVQGACICRGVLAAADELGVDTDSIVDPFRRDRHRDSLQGAQLAARQLDLIGSDLPQPPFPDLSKRTRGSEPRRQSALLLPKATELSSASGRSKRSRRPWK
jgi:hypothetical protein